MKPLFSALLLVMLPLGVWADTLYLCKAYAGGNFWSSVHCSKHQALIERIVTVPSGLPFDQQVNIGNQQTHQRSSGSSSTVSVTTHTSSEPDRRTECESLKSHIVHLDSMARQPQSGETQDWISDKKAKARSRQFQLRC